MATKKRMIRPERQMEKPSEEHGIEYLNEEHLSKLSALQLFDLFTEHPLEADSHLRVYRLLRERISELEEVQDQATSAIEQLSAVVDKLKSPALRLGTLLRRLASDRAMVCVGGTDYLCAVLPTLSETVLETGMRVVLNEAFCVVDSLAYERNGPIVKIIETFADGRLRVGSEHGLSDAVVIRSTLLAKEKLKSGLEVRLDPSQRVVVEVLAPSRRRDRIVSNTLPVPWSAVGGQAEAIEAIRDTIELPYLHANLFKKFEHPIPKGFLLYGPPGCGKTLTGRATAHNLRLRILEKTGEDHPEFFLHVKGPEILNMWLGESERQVRDLFTQCREKAAEGGLAFLFIDEADSILGTRGAHRYGTSIISTLVPTFCAEMDGIEPLENVVTILASNRADLIDPAILRPGRIDRKIRIRRPGREAAAEIYRIYLTENLPLEEPREALIEQMVEAHYAESEENRFLEITFRSGKRDYIYRGGISSGAVIAAVVERAKGLAIKRAVREGKDSRISRNDLLNALNLEYAENELFPPSDLTEDWLKLTDFDPSTAIRLKPYRAKREQTPASAI